MKCWAGGRDFSCTVAIQPSNQSPAPGEPGPFLREVGFSIQACSEALHEWGHLIYGTERLLVGVHSLLSLAFIPLFYWSYSYKHSTTTHLLKWDRSRAKVI